MAASLSLAAVSLVAIASAAAAWSPGPDGSMNVPDIVSISVFMAVCFPVFVVLIAFTCLRLFRLPDEPPAADTSSSEWSHGGGRDGLDAAAIAALPLVFYRDVRRHRPGGGGDGDGDALECAVCLLEFGDDDALRLLPTCPHAFHPECIGLWLEKHVTCPLCRASVLDAPPDPLQQEAAPPPGSPPPAVHETVVVLVGDAGGRDVEEEDERTRIQRLAWARRAAGRQALPRSNSTGHERAGGMERFALRLPEHVRLEILMSHRLRHVTSAVASVRVREGSAHDAVGVGGSVRNAVARLLSLFVPGGGWKRDDEDKSGGRAADGSSRRRRDGSARGVAGEEKRSD